jgi:hypothetical protein
MKKMRRVYFLLIFPIILLVQSKEVTGKVLDENKMLFATNILEGIDIDFKKS